MPRAKEESPDAKRMRTALLAVLVLDRIEVRPEGSPVRRELAEKWQKLAPNRSMTRRALCGLVREALGLADFEELP